MCVVRFVATFAVRYGDKVTSRTCRVKSVVCRTLRYNRHRDNPMHYPTIFETYLLTRRQRAAFASLNFHSITSTRAWPSLLWLPDLQNLSSIFGCMSIRFSSRPQCLDEPMQAKSKPGCHVPRQMVIFWTKPALAWVSGYRGFLARRLCGEQWPNWQGGASKQDNHGS